MIHGVSIRAVLTGVLASQAASMTIAPIFVVVLFFIYGNSALVAFLEYPTVIATLMFITLVTAAIGGYVAMCISPGHKINAAMLGVMSLLINGGLLHLVDYTYAAQYPWLLALTAILLIPAGLFGAQIYSKVHS